MSTKVKRLYEQFQPEHYEIELRIDPRTKKIRGLLVVTGKKVGRPSERLTFHQRSLKVSKATITRHDKKGEQSFKVARINHHASFDEVRLHSDASLYAGNYTITMEFTGKVQDSMHGVYVCNYQVDGKKQQLIGTQFESHYAREGFPCIDEPEAKATFDITLITPDGQTVVGNTPVKAQSSEPNAKSEKASKLSAKEAQLKTAFETTPKMSPYLVAFAFGELQSKQTTSQHGIETAIWATKAHKPEALDFALEVAPKGLDFFNDYYGVPYPLTKMDHLALPDFSAGAMENWGLITYRESCLVGDPASLGQSGRERIALVMCHELSHQWFGDLVTMVWWDYLWLNESFANVMEYVAVNALFPEWEVWNEFVAHEGLSAIRRDCIAGVQAVQISVNHPDEISSLFDPSIVYAKGGRLLNTLMHYIGEDNFRSGLKKYFEKHAYGNTTGEDLWQALSGASGQNVSAFMNPWLTQSGYPVVSVTQKGSQVQISQAHFLLDADQADPKRLWPVALFPNDDRLPQLLETQTTTVELPTSDYVRINSGAVGHYIVCYTEPEHLAALAEQARDKKLSAAERLMLLHDSSLLARAGQQSFADTMTLLQYYTNEDSEPVWGIMAAVISDCRRFVDVDEALEAPIKALVRNLIETEYSRLGWDEKPGEPAHDTKLRATILGLGVFAEHPVIVSEALKRFETYKQNPSSISGELRGVVLGAAVRDQAPGAFDYLVQLSEKTNDVQLQDDLLGALTTTKLEVEADKLLDRIKDADKVRPQDVDHWLALLLRNRYVRAPAWKWLRDNWGWIKKTFGDDKSYDYFPRYAAMAFSTPELLVEYKIFFEPMQSNLALARNISMGIAEIETRIAWLQRDLPAIKTFFQI